jgi:hypothetical protein
MTIMGVAYDSLVTLMLFLAAFSLGWQTLYAFQIRAQQCIYLWLAATCGLGVLSVGTLLLGLLGLLYQWLFIAILIPLALYGALLLIRIDWREKFHRRLRGKQYNWLFRISAYLLIGISIGTLLWITLTHALMPPHEWDEIAYHLTLPRLYVEAHRVIYVPFIVTSNWPLNNEMLFGIALLFNADRATHLIMLTMALMIPAGLILLAHRIFDNRVGVIAATLFLAVPLVKRLAGTGLIDVALGLYVLAALVALHFWMTERRWPWLALCGMFCGFAAGSKLTGGGFPILLGLLIIIDEIRRRPWRIDLLLRHGTLFGVAGLLVAGPWYARSFILTGNPLWPFAFHIFGGRDWDALGDEYHMQLLLDVWTPGISRDLGGLLTTSRHLIHDPAILGGYHAGIGAILPIGALCGMALIGVAPRFLRQSLFVCGGFYLLWFSFASLQVRYLLPIVPLLALITAYVIVWSMDRLPWKALRAIVLIGVLVLVARESPWLKPDERQLFIARLPYLRGQVSWDTWIDQQIDSMPLFRYANTHLPADARILLLPYENRTYYLEREYIWGHPISQRIIPFEQFDNVEELAATLRHMGITHVIEHPAWMFTNLRYWERIFHLMQALREECGQPVYQQGDSVLYELQPCQVSVLNVKDEMRRMRN